MQTRLIDRVHDTALDGGVLSYLPAALAAEISGYRLARIEEIRLRCGGVCSLTSDKLNVPLSYRFSRAEMDETVKKMCDGSLYAHADTINRGYIIMQSGVRVGICGRAVTKGNELVGVYDVTSLCIRLPHRAPDVGVPICELLRSSEFLSGVLIYSPPGEGKTTLLRSVIAKISTGNGAIRTAVIDTRGELSCFLPNSSSADILSGYPRGIGIEIAARTLNPELIVCDELGADEGEATAVAAAHNCGVALLATAHAGDISELKNKRGIALLAKLGIFSHYVGIRRAGDDYSYTFDDDL